MFALLCLISFLKVFKTLFIFILAALGPISKEVKAGSQDICTHVHRNIIHSCQKLEIAQITIDG